MGKRFNGGNNPPKHQSQPVYEHASVRGRGRSVTITGGSGSQEPWVIENALRRLKRQVRNDGVLAEVEDRQTFTKPNEQRRRNKAAAIKRNKRRIANSQPKPQGGRHGR